MRTGWLLLAFVLCSGCGLLPTAAPAWVTDRPELPSCGDEETARGEGINPDARRCLLEAFEAGRSAELISTVTTIEGDPIRRYLRVLEDGRVEILVDATQDRFGSQDWQRYECDRIVAIGESENPPDVMLDEASIFIEEGCLPAEPA